MIRIILDELNACESVLDVGTGHGAIISRVHGPKRRVGIDACIHAIDVARFKHRDIDFRVTDVRNINMMFGPDEFDAVVGFDIVEHLEKHEALELFDVVDRIAKRVVWWFIPIGSHPQEYDPRNEGNAELQKHRSEWQPHELAERGYQVFHYPDWHARNKDVVERGKSTEAAFCRRTPGSVRLGRVTEERRYRNARVG